MTTETSTAINWDLIQALAAKPHKHLHIAEGETYGVMVDCVFDTGGGVDEVAEIRLTPDTVLRHE